MKTEPMDETASTATTLESVIRKSNSITKTSISDQRICGQSSSSSTFPKLPMPALQKSVIVSAPSALAPTPAATQFLAAGNANVIHSSLRENFNRRVLLVMKQAGAVPQNMASASATMAASLITPPAVLPPPPPLRRIPVAGVGSIFSFPILPEAPPLISGLAAETLSEQLQAGVDINEVVIETNGVACTAAEAELGESSTAVVGPGKDPISIQAAKRKRRKRSRPTAVRPLTREELERVQEFKRLFREGQSSSMEEAVAESMAAVPVEPEIVVDTSPSPTEPSPVARQALWSAKPRQPAQVPVVLSSRPRPPRPIVRMQSPPQPAPSVASIPSQEIPSTSTKTQEEIDEHRLRRMRNNEAVRRSRLKARLKVKQSELNCRVLVKQFGELKTRIQELEKELSWEKRKNEILEEMLRRTQMNATAATAGTQAEEGGSS